ncbi:hypothetical protein VTO42DRAFT_6932 [Malbranchea cinnamomea]
MQTEKQAQGEAAPEILACRQSTAGDIGCLGIVRAASRISTLPAATENVWSHTLSCEKGRREPVKAPIDALGQTVRRPRKDFKAPQWLSPSTCQVNVLLTQGSRCFLTTRIFLTKSDRALNQLRSHPHCRASDLVLTGL